MFRMLFYGIVFFFVYSFLKHMGWIPNLHNIDIMRLLGR